MGQCKFKNVKQTELKEEGIEFIIIFDLYNRKNS